MGEVELEESEYDPLTCDHPSWYDHIDVKMCTQCFKVEPIEYQPKFYQGELW